MSICESLLASYKDCCGRYYAWFYKDRVPPFDFDALWAEIDDEIAFPTVSAGDRITAPGWAQLTHYYLRYRQARSHANALADAIDTGMSWMQALPSFPASTVASAKAAFLALDVSLGGRLALAPFETFESLAATLTAYYDSLTFGD